MKKSTLLFSIVLTLTVFDPVKKLSAQSSVEPVFGYSLDSTNISGYTLKKISEEYFDQYTNEGERATFDNTYKKVNGTLRLPLASGKELVLTDTSVSNGGVPLDDSFILNEYIGQFSSINYYMVETERYEMLDYELVDKDNGKKYFTPATTILSPKATTLMAIVDYDDASFLEAPYLTLYFRPVSGRKLTAEEYDLVNLYIQPTSDQYASFPEEEYEVHWENEKTVLLKLTFRGNADRKHSDYLRIEVK